MGQQTNIRGETPQEAYKTAVANAAAPFIRDYLHGRDVDIDAFNEELTHQLKNRGFTITDRNTQ